MAEFTKRKRFFKYTDKSCKKFLSRDFLRRCAYCKIREGDLGGPESFEIDHFVPETKGGSDNYDNLYYACASCNGKSGKSDSWSETLLDPCKEDIYGVHITLLNNYRFHDVTPQGEEYIKTLRLNRKSYVRRRETLARHRKELEIKLSEYKEAYQQVFLSGNIVGMAKVFEDDIKEIEAILEYGVNYRISRDYFDEDIDKIIYNELEKIGEVRCVDMDYDLFYELKIGTKMYLCCSEIDTLEFGTTGKVRRYISREKIDIWREIERETPILLITFNTNDNQIYYTKMSTIMQSAGVSNPDRCAYYVGENRLIDDLQTLVGD